MSILNEIVAYKHEIVARDRKNVSLEALIDEIAIQNKQPRGFRKQLITGTAPCIIAEIKKYSPSHGLIRENFHVAQLAMAYQQAGAQCLSILTDEKYFMGENNFLMQAKNAVHLPILRKDFIIDAYQIYQSRLLGADCILLIMAILKDETVANFYHLAQSLNMDVLVEIHDKIELERALKFSPNMLGVNNRNLKTLVTDLNNSKILAEFIPKNALFISESGISTAQDLKQIADYGAKAFLIGEFFMRQENVEIALSQLIHAFQNLAKK